MIEVSVASDEAIEFVPASEPLPAVISAADAPVVTSPTAEFVVPAVPVAEDPAADAAPETDAPAAPADIDVIAVPATRTRAQLRLELSEQAAADAAASVAGDAEPVADDASTDAWFPTAPAPAAASRRAARSARAEEEQEQVPSRGRRSATPDESVAPRAYVPTVAIPVAAKPQAPAAAASVPRRLSRQLAAKSMGGLVIAVVALLAVATSTPANALLSSADVQAATTIAAESGSDGPAQTMSVGDQVGAIAVQRDGYDTSTVAQVAAESGIRLEASFTNDPNGTVQWPFRVGVHIGDRFGARDCAGCSSDHHGQDFNPGLGAPIQAIADGVVSYAEDGDGDLGVHMMIDHVINGQVVTSVYAHMVHGSMNFKVGDTVKVGDIVGKTGNTGMSTGPHLHFEIRLGGRTGPWTDPLTWLYANTN